MALQQKVVFPYPCLNLLLQNVVDGRGKIPVMSSSENPVPNVTVPFNSLPRSSDILVLVFSCYRSIPKLILSLRFGDLFLETRLPCKNKRLISKGFEASVSNTVLELFGVDPVRKTSLYSQANG